MFLSVSSLFLFEIYAKGTAVCPCPGAGPLGLVTAAAAVSAATLLGRSRHFGLAFGFDFI